MNNKIKVPHDAEELVGKAVEHLFEKEDGEKNEWRGMVLSRAPIMTNWYYITYEKDPVLYMYQLWDDYKDGDLRILPEAGKRNLSRLKIDYMPGLYNRILDEFYVHFLDCNRCYSSTNK